MRRGDLLGDRFEIEERAGAGGMGQVFRSRDVQSGERVAVKMLLGQADSHEARFAMETRALSELSHPGIVRYVAHGVAASGEPYLAMEWLDGEDLSDRLRRGALGMEESVEVALRVAEALGAAHERGIVHRDLKPSNIFLVNGRIDQVKLLDFGIARLSSVTRLTQTGAVIGTPGYMAPEQVQSNRAVDARADVFSLGCVLFECLTGTAAFVAEHPMALLAKVVFAEPPRLCDVLPDAPEALDGLLSQMLAKDPAERPRNGTALAEALAALETGMSARGGAAPPVALTRGERRTIFVVLVGANREGANSGECPDARTLDPAEADTESALRRAAGEYGGQFGLLRDGTAVVSIASAGLATDQAAQAARCALALRKHSAGRPVALATGRGDTTGARATGEAIDRAAKMLVSRPADTADEGIAIDEMTARLLDGRFDVREGDEGLSLHGEREMAEGARLLLQKPTACVGRDRELSTLAQMFAECVEEPLAQAALVTGTAGMGKSRLAQEFLARLRVQGEPPAMWIGRGDSLRAGSALGLLGQALRGTCGIRGDEPLRERRDKLLSRVAQHVHPDHRQRVAELLGEVAGVPFPDDESHLLRAARRNTQIMTDEMRRAWVDFLRAETGVQPVLLVLEDLHWGDGATVRFIDAALRDLGERPWMVLALARPEVHALFPTLWADRRIQEIQIKPLSKKASERLVRQVLGAEIGADTAERIIAQADGNAFYLEELIRAAAEHQAETLPETVIAMVESRLAALEGEDRRALRAAAVFGEVFWPGGVATLLGSAERSAHVQARLLGLVEREVLVKRPDSRFAGELELAFRHVLLREGAYAMLTSDDRIVGHKRAGEWLERAGETDSKLLAEHFDRGGEVERAAAHYVRAADQALEGGDCEVAIKLTERGVTLGGEPELLAGLRAVEGEAKLRRGDLEGAYVAAGAALRFARPGSRTEGRALYSGILGAVNAGNSDLLREPAERLLHTYPEPDAITQVAAAFFSVVTSLTWQVKGDMAARYLRRLEEVTSIVMNHDPLVGVWVELTRSTHACHVERDFWGALKHAQRAAFYYEQSATRDVLPFGRSFIAFFCPLLGTFDHAEEEFSRALTTDHATAMETFNVQIYRGMMLIDQRKLDEASALLGRVLHELRPQAESLTRIVCRLHWTELQLYKGALEDAELEAIALQDLAGDHPYLGMWYLAVLACIRLAQGRAGEASEIAERAFAQSQACGMGYCCRHAMLLLVRAEAFHALGDQDAACQAIREARDDLLRRAAKIPDSEPEVRRCFLENLPDHRRTLELAREWLGEEGVARAGHLTDPR